MEFRIRNLGQVTDTTLDLRPLTVIVGQNNTNKTWLAYGIYGWLSLAEAMRHPDLFVALPIRSSAVDEAESARDAIVELVSQQAKGVTRFLNAEWDEFFQAAKPGGFAHARVEGVLTDREIGPAVDAAIGQLRRRAAGGNGEAGVQSPLPRERLFSAVARRALDSLCCRPFILPAERNALVITSKLLANRRLRAMRASRRHRFDPKMAREMALLREQGETFYPRPVEDFLDFLADIDIDGPRRRMSSAFIDVDRLIETHVNRGNRLVLVPTDLGGTDLKVEVEEKRGPIGLAMASSSIKQLAPLLLYLRLRAQPGDLLVIDEPEMNLHPASQVRLLEALAVLVDSGVYVLLTTHSPYLLSHLNTLALEAGRKKKARERQAAALYLNDPKALLGMDRISAYELVDGELRSLKDPEYGIRWDTLSDVSSEVQSRYWAVREVE